MADKFNSAAAHASSPACRGATASQKIRMYGCYKQQSLGDCSGQRPGLTQPIPRAKFDAWATCRGMEAHEARAAYIEVVCEVDPSFRRSLAGGEQPAARSAGGSADSAVEMAALATRSPQSARRKTVRYSRRGSDGGLTSSQVAAAMVGAVCASLFVLTLPFSDIAGRSAGPRAEQSLPWARVAAGGRLVGALSAEMIRGASNSLQWGDVGSLPWVQGSSAAVAADTAANSLEGSWVSGAAEALQLP